MAETPPKLELRIRRKKAAPDHCPVCGLERQYRGPFDYLWNYYSAANRVERRPVDGWPGFYEWWYVCHHQNPMQELVYSTGFLLKEKYADFSGKSYSLPFKTSK